MTLYCSWFNILQLLQVAVFCGAKSRFPDSALFEVNHLNCKLLSNFWTKLYDPVLVIFVILGWSYFCFATVLYLWLDFAHRFESVPPNMWMGQGNICANCHLPTFLGGFPFTKWSLLFFPWRSCQTNRVAHCWRPSPLHCMWWCNVITVRTFQPCTVVCFCCV